MSCQDRVQCYADLVIEDVSAWLFAKGGEGVHFTWATIPWRFFLCYDTAFLRAAYLFGGPEMEWVLDNMGWPD